MHFLAYNLKRVINIVGVKELVAFLNSIILRLFLVIDKIYMKSFKFEYYCS